ncbi:MAG: hypothetical protein ACOYU7_01610 [Bacillota bacterium]
MIIGIAGEDAFEGVVQVTFDAANPDTKTTLVLMKRPRDIEEYCAAVNQAFMIELDEFKLLGAENKSATKMLIWHPEDEVLEDYDPAKHNGIAWELPRTVTTNKRARFVAVPRLTP